MKPIKFYIISILVLISAQVFAQYMSGPKLSGVGLPYFRTGIFRSFDETGSNRLVDVYVQILNDDLAFIKEADLFRAEIEYEIFINNKDRDFFFNETFREVIETPDFSRTNSRSSYNTYFKTIEVPAGNYDAVITVHDRNSNKQVNRKVQFKVEDFQETEFLISDILFFNDFETDSLGNIIDFVPNLASNFSGRNKHVYFYFTTIIQDSIKALDVFYKIKGGSNHTALFNRYTVSGDKKFQKHYVRLNRQQFDQNRYELEVRAKYHDHSIKTRKLFSFFWTEAPQSPRDLNLALEQMKYILDADSIGWAMKQDYPEKLGYFKRFWRRMDPNEGTVKNELMDEYFRRVNFASLNFSSLASDGWRTDRGRIFIKFGQPDDIERHPFEMNSNPYEIWHFYQLRKTFLFVDRTGFGDYYIHPNYLDEEYN